MLWGCLGCCGDAMVCYGDAMGTVGMPWGCHGVLWECHGHYGDAVGAVGMPWGAVGAVGTVGCPHGGVDGRWQCCTGAALAPGCGASWQVAAVMNCSCSEPRAARRPAVTAGARIALRLPWVGTGGISHGQALARPCWGASGLQPLLPAARVLEGAEEALRTQAGSSVRPMAVSVPWERQERERSLQSPFIPLEIKAFLCPPGGQPSHAAGRRGPEHGPGPLGITTPRPKQPPREEPGPSSTTGVTLALSPRLVLRGHVHKGKGFQQQRFLSQGISFSKSSFEGGECGVEESLDRSDSPISDKHTRLSLTANQQDMFQGNIISEEMDFPPTALPFLLVFLKAGVTGCELYGAISILLSLA